MREGERDGEGGVGVVEVEGVVKDEEVEGVEGVVEEEGVEEAEGVVKEEGT